MSVSVSLCLSMSVFHQVSFYLHALKFLKAELYLVQFFVRQISTYLLLLLMLCCFFSGTFVKLDFSGWILHHAFILLNFSSPTLVAIHGSFPIIFKLLPITIMAPFIIYFLSTFKPVISKSIHISLSLNFIIFGEGTIFDGIIEC